MSPSQQGGAVAGSRAESERVEATALVVMAEATTAGKLRAMRVAQEATAATAVVVMAEATAVVVMAEATATTAAATTGATGLTGARARARARARVVVLCRGDAEAARAAATVSGSWAAERAVTKAAEGARAPARARCARCTPPWRRSSSSTQRGGRCWCHYKSPPESRRGCAAGPSPGRQIRRTPANSPTTSRSRRKGWRLR